MVSIKLCWTEFDTIYVKELLKSIKNELELVKIALV